MKKILVLLVALILSNAGYAIAGTEKTRSFNEMSPQRIVSGTVIDETGLALPGVTIKIQGTSRGVITDKDGKYSIQVNNNTEVLVFSFVGYLSQKIVIGEKTVLDI